jgi:hypothetical protein
MSALLHNHTIVHYTANQMMCSLYEHSKYETKTRECSCDVFMKWSSTRWHDTGQMVLFFLIMVGPVLLQQQTKCMA